MTLFMLQQERNSRRELIYPVRRLKGVIHGINCLKDVNLKRDIKLGHTVAVIGGGNTALIQPEQP